MKPHSSKISKRRGGKRQFSHSKKDGATFHKKRKTSITFDADARREYLTGFSERKRQRRAYGLAMQKVKDRTAKLQEKRETKQATLQQVEQAEAQKKQLLREKHGSDAIEEDDDKKGEESDTSDDNNTTTTTTTTRYQDMQTQSQFGGQVIVTTSTLPPSDDEGDSDADVRTEQDKKNVDSQQRYAGNVSKYLHELKGSMPGKKKKRDHSFKGRHGAANMKGMGGASNLKMAQKALSKTQAKNIKKERKGKRKRH